MVPPGFDIVKGYNWAPGQYVVIVRPEKGQRVADVALWGLIPSWVKDPNGEVMVSACIITTQPNELMAEIHNRMSVILPKDAWGLWLDPAAQVREVQHLLIPYPAELMAAHPVSAAVGNTRNDGPKLILAVTSNQG